MTDLPPIFDETEMQTDLGERNSDLSAMTREDLERTVRSLSRRLAARFNENRKLSAGYDRLREYSETLKKTNKVMDARSLRRIQAQVGEWRKAAYPDTATLELQTIGVAEEVGELAHAVLKFKQGIRGYDLDKTQIEAADAIGDIIIYAMGVADCLGINVEDALFKTAQHVINRNITQGSDAGNEPTKVSAAMIYSMTMRKLVKGDRVRVIAGDEFPLQFGTVMPEVEHPEGMIYVMLDGKDSPWSFAPEHLMRLESIEQASAREKGVDYAGHVPVDEGMIVENKAHMSLDNLSDEEKIIARQAIAQSTKNTYIPARPIEQGTHNLDCNDSDCLGNCF